MDVGPLHLPPAHIFRSWRAFIGHCRFWGGPYRFRKLPGDTRKRWGGGIWGFEFGNRG